MKQLKKLAMTIVGLWCCMAASAADFEWAWFSYNILSETDLTVEVTKGPYSGDVSIPSTVTYNGQSYSVTSIGYGAFRDTQITSITIPESVTSIGNRAFDGCYNLTSITIPNSVTTICDCAFQYCFFLASLTISGSVKSIGKKAFYGCSSLYSVTVESKIPITLYDGDTFSRRAYATLKVPLGSRKAYMDAAVWNEFMNIVEYGEVENIKFADAKVKELCVAKWDTTNDGELSKEEAALVSDLGTVFYNEDITSFNELQYFTGLKSIRSCAFYRCRSLKSITIPEGVTSIGDRAFESCAFTSITIPEGVTSIDNYAFYECYNLTSITLPESVTSIGEDAFRGCHLPIENHIRYADKWAVGVDDYTLTSYTLKNDTRGLIGTFEGCWALEQITIPETVICLSGHVFSRCHNLISIEIPSEATILGDSTFFDCVDLKSVNLPSKMEIIGTEAFAECTSLTSVKIPNSVTIICSKAFYNCSNLSIVTVDSKTPITLYSEDTFSHRRNATLNVPSGSKAAYEAADVWNEFKNIKEIVEYDVVENITFADAKVRELCVTHWDTNVDGELSKAEAAAVSDLGTVFQNNKDITSFNELQYFTGLKSIGDNAFYGCSNLTSITIPESVTSIGYNAFNSCTGLTSVHISDIAAWCKIDFERNSSNPLYYAHHLYKDGKEITNLEIPEGVTVINNYAFYGCTGLTSVSIPGSVTSIGKYPFYGCKSLTSVHISDIAAWCKITFGDFDSNPLYYAHHLYKDGKEITNLEIPEGITVINNYAFSACTGLTSVSIPGSVTSIGKYAFRDCTGLTSITIPGSVTSIGETAFYGCTGLTSVSIPGSVTSIGNDAFYKCKSLTSVHISDIAAWCNIDFSSKDSNPLYYAKHLYMNGKEITNLEIPESVTSIGDYAFNGCSALTEITCKAITPPACGTDVFKDVDKTIPLYVPKGSVIKYKAVDGWRDFVIIREIAEAGSDVYLTINDGSKGNVKLKVDDDKPYFSLKIEPEAGWHIHSVTFNDGDVTAELSADGEYVTPVIGTDSQLGIVYAQGSSSINSVSDSKIRVWASGNSVIVEGAEYGKTINVYTIDGIMAASVNADSDRVVIPLQSGDVYIVKIGEQTLKVAL